MTIQDETAKQMDEWQILVQQMENNGLPFRDEAYALVKQLASLRDGIATIIKKWTVEFLEKTPSHNSNADPAGKNFEDYSKAIIVPAEMIRKLGFSDLAHRVYQSVVEATDVYCATTGKDFHRGAIYTNYGITFLELHHFELGLSWLLAAANEDVRFNRIPDVTRSYALQSDGVFGQWVGTRLMKMLPVETIPFVEKTVGAIGHEDVMDMLRSLAKRGDLHFFRGIVQYESVQGRKDYLGHSVRFNSLRDLATLFEILAKQIGEIHVDHSVRGEFAKSPMLGSIVHYMHYNGKPNATSWSYKEGLFWNSVEKRTEQLEVIRSSFDFVKDFKNNSIADVWAHLNSLPPLASGNADEEELGKRVLLAYRLRNETSHSSKPMDAGFVAHADELRLWLLQGILHLYFSFTRTGQAAL